ncbi:tRNA (guanine-N(7)-)-methyltransferase non-catalytic subunit wdr4 [Anthophora plagiata]
MSFCIYESDIVLCNNEQIVICNIEDDTETTIHLPELQTEKKIDVHNNVNIETFHTITNVTFSNDGKYFLICTNRKQLCLYETKTRNILLNKVLPRAASKVQFTPNNDIVVADKTGDAYLFSNKQSDNGALLLGHLSMLLDVLVTEDERKFVTNILELPHDKTVLMSCGGDGTFILWDYKIGRELLSVDFRSKISSSDIEKFNRHLQDCHLEETIEVLPVKHLKLSALNESSSLAVMSFYNNSLLLVYVINGTLKSNFEATHLQSITTDDEPIEYCLYKSNLWLLNNTGFKVYEFKDNTFVLSDAMNLQIGKLNNCWKALKRDGIQQNLFSILYKRKYDNVQEYLQRKKTRLTNTYDM